MTVGGSETIESLIEGIKVNSFDKMGQAIIERAITQVLRNRTVCLVGITTGDESLRVTKHYRFWVENYQRWLEAMDLEPGMRLRTIHGESSVITSVDFCHTTEQETYNLTIADSHTYFVGQSGFLVHNEGGDEDEVGDERRDGKIYIGSNSDGEPIYVGQTVQPIKDREAEHQRDAIKDPEKYGFKNNMTLAQVPGMGLLATKCFIMKGVYMINLRQKDIICKTSLCL